MTLKNLPPRHFRPVPAPVPPEHDWICADGCGRTYALVTSSRHGKPACPYCGRDAELFGQAWKPRPAAGKVVRMGDRP